MRFPGQSACLEVCGSCSPKVHKRARDTTNPKQHFRDSCSLLYWYLQFPALGHPPSRARWPVSRPFYPLWAPANCRAPSPLLRGFWVEKNKNKTKKTGRSHHGQRKQQPLVPLAPNHFSHHAPGQRPPRVLCRSKFSSEDPFSVMSVSWFSPKPLQDVKNPNITQSPGKEF